MKIMHLGEEHLLTPGNYFWNTSLSSIGTILSLRLYYLYYSILFMKSFFVNFWNRKLSFQFLDYSLSSGYSILYYIICYLLINLRIWKIKQKLF